MASNKQLTEGKFNLADVKFIFECLKNMDSNKQVDLSIVAGNLGYTNVASAGNRFRAMRKRYGFANLDCTTSGAMPKSTNSSATPCEQDMQAATKPTGKGKAAKVKVEEDSDTTDDSAGTAAQSKVAVSKKRAPRKGAKVSSKPITATGPVGEDSAKGTSKTKVKQEVISTSLLEAVEVAISTGDKGKGKAGANGRNKT